jgi:fibronectin type 3 domain-containing protein
MPARLVKRSPLGGGFILAAGLLLLSNSAWSQIQKDACDLNSDGVDNSADVTLAVNMDVGLSACTANVIGVSLCNVVVVQRVTNAALGGACSAGNPHTTTLSWTASTTPNVSYNIYRSSTAGGPYIKIGSVGVGLVSYIDSQALAGEIYFYVVRAMDNTNTESANSTEVQAQVPFP